MLMFRRLAHAILVSALLAGCSQSLFDDGNTDDDDGNMPGIPDAAPGTPDGAPPVTGPDGGGQDPDGGLESPDAAPRAECPLPCSGDAFKNFYYPASRPGRWRYVEIQPEELETPYAEMTSTIFEGAVLGWQGTTSTPPLVALCAAEEFQGPCVGLQGTVALQSPGNATGAHQPALMFTAPATGLYYLTGDWRLPSAATPVETTMKFLRSTLSVIEEETVLLTGDTYQFTQIELPLDAGEAFLLSATATTAESVTVGVNLFVQGPI